MEKKAPLLTIRPHFSPLLASLESLAVALVGTVGLSLVGGTVLLALVSTTGLDRFISGGTIYISLLVLGMALLPPLYYEIKRQAYRNTLYSFYEDSLEFQYFQHLINRRVGRISYRDITNVAEQANVVQQREQITTVYLFVPSFGVLQRNGFAGLKMTDLPRSKNWSAEIINLIEQRQPSSPAVPVPTTG